VVDEVKARLDIVDVVSGYVHLQKAGRNFKALCPFHHEKTPSFVVFPENQSWHCFGACGTGGDVFTFIMKRENLDFGEALALLAERAGVELQPRAGAAPADEQKFERLRQIVAEAATYYHYLLVRSEEASIARAYLERRGFVRQTWENWQLGYALDSWDALKDRLTAKGYTLAELEEAGLIIRREDGSGYYDRFRGRLMIPIRDVQGRAVGFGARVLREDPERPQPKYINSPQTPIFDKGSLLYGLDMAKKAIREADMAVLVEGYMDVLMSHQVGVANVVAGMGTALTETQMRLLRRYSGNLTLALDPDVAGDHATMRGLEAARQAMERVWQPTVGPSGLVRQESRLKAQLRIASLPDGLDPDELARADVERWRRVIAEAQPIVDYYLARVGQEEDLTTARGKANAVERMAPLIREIGNPVERDHYIQRLARLVQADERLVAEQVMRRSAAAFQPAAAEPRPRGEPPAAQPTSPAAALKPALDRSSASQRREALLLGYLLERPELWAALDAQLIEMSVSPFSPEDFSDTENRAAAAALQANLPVVLAGETDDLIGLLPEALWPCCREALALARRHPELTDEKLLKDMGDLVLRLRQDSLRQQVARLRYLIGELEASGQREELRPFHELMTSYTAQIGQFQKLLNARTMAGALVRAGQELKSTAAANGAG
ncbi:MAG: DNA primase, partial [Anaerolineae bacterium]